jgi:hypothetical protein
MQMSLALTPLLKLAAAADDSKPELAMAASMLEQTGADHIRVLQRPTANGVIARIEAEEGVLKMLGVFAAQARMRQQGGF